MVQKLNATDFIAATLCSGTIVDVRSPSEYALGHIVGAVNLPLFDDMQRAIVGTTYKQQGREKAIEQGLNFVGGTLSYFVQQGRSYGSKHLFLYCARGGMRSESMAWLLDMAGIKVSVLIGGYKAYRTHFEELITNHPWRINLLGGSTGSAKTSILHALASRGEQVIDLEAIACHKGSVFGGFGQNQQPTTEHFFNLLHHEFCKLDPLQVVWCEGESMLIGHLFLPKFLFDLMYKGQYIEVYMNVEQRLDRLCIEYGHFSADLLIEAFSKIKKRIGTEQYNLALDAIMHGHIRTAATIALKYYDKAYMNSCITPDFRQEVDNDNIDSAIEQLINKV